LPDQRDIAHPQVSFLEPGQSLHADHSEALHSEALHSEPPSQGTRVVNPTEESGQREVPTRRVELPESRMRRSFRIPIIAALVWIVTMLAIFYLGRQVSGYYAPVVQGDRVEFVGRS